MTKKEKGKINRRKPVSSEAFVLKYAHAWLVLAVILVYFKTFLFTGLTHLDDTIFIFDKLEFNKHLSNIFHAFNVGCFNEKDIYYRPLFLVTFILEEPFRQHSYTVYHFTNLLLHAVNVLLLFLFLQKINIPKYTAFILALLYAVHPVLTMAVSWIPGRNDLLLATFTYLFFLFSIRFAEKQNLQSYLLQLLFYLLCLFTKETAVFIPFAAVLLFYCVKKENLLQKKYYFLAVGWFGALLLWFVKRKAVLPEASPTVVTTGLLENFEHRSPGLLQYLGKILLPFNLSVFPTIEATSFIFGIAALIILAVIVWLNKERDNKMVLLGAAWFVFFILPFFFVPKNINDQLFEHRLYLPIAGILILLGQSVFFSRRFSVTQIIGGGFLLSLFFAVLTLIYMGQFDNELVFWSNAVHASPQSAYANKMYGIKLSENKKTDEAIPYFKKAYSLDSTERYTNLFLARLIYIPTDSIADAERALKNEIRLNPTFSDTYFELAHVYFLKKNLEAAKTNLLKFLSYRPSDEMANNNLLKLYVDLKQFPLAQQQINAMEQMNITVDDKTKTLVSSALQSTTYTKK